MLQRRRNHATKFALGLAVVLGWAGQSFGVATATIVAPAPGSASVSRYDANAKANKQNSNVTYVALVENGYVKFEDASTVLGENGAVQTDTFVVQGQNIRDWCKVTIKAGSDEQHCTLVGVGDSKTATNFTVTMTACNTSTGEITFEVTSDADNGTPALSHINFEIGVTPPSSKEAVD